MSGSSLTLKLRRWFSWIIKLYSSFRNLYKALHCLKTMTEVVAIVLYGGTVSHPYSQMVCRPGTESLNVLDLGQLQEEMKQHLKLIFTNPELIFGANVAPETGPGVILLLWLQHSNLPPSLSICIQSH
ncbi:hypothetical protein SERLA73DRAFT_174699 [Serpula lacrymans var. lacrymans S7.3]|uniref:Uncharacterized protein n=1 Tax=Serpula lacrymans var. lacrymans (strain S7.3) TaxID=936435 RepID=F8PJN8_SERL3|nr:hypothetical protein SERLA73DRAFT_174699 [Serpula lacrymans var. lacrymans S7.3]